MQIWLDCDGVLADFNFSFEQRFGESSDSYEEAHGSAAFWKAIKNCRGFFEHLPVMPDAKMLFDEVKHLRPIILTGCPFGDWAEVQKMKWRNKHFTGIPMVTTMSKHKKDYCHPGDILVDDVLKYKHLWEEAGGIFILHTSADSTIKQLKEFI